MTYPLHKRLDSTRAASLASPLPCHCCWVVSGAVGSCLVLQRAVMIRQCSPSIACPFCPIFSLQACMNLRHTQAMQSITSLCQDKAIHIIS